MNNEIPSFKLNDFQIGHKFRNYQLLEQIGQGGQGMVWSALEPGKERIVAIKFKELGTDVADLRADDVLFDRQVGPLLELRHEHVLPILDFGQFGQIQYLVSPFIPGRGAGLRQADCLRPELPARAWSDPPRPETLQRADG